MTDVTDPETDPFADRFRLETTQDDTVTLVRVSGDVDLDTAALLEHALTMATEFTAHLVVDCTGITFMDAAGLRVLRDAQARQHERGARLTLRGPQPSVRRLLDLAGLAGAVEPG